MRTALYLLWLLVPALFFVLALWIKLERLSGESKKESASDLLNQGLFTLGCAVASIAIDQLFLQDIIEATVGDLFPLGFYQFFLFPLVLLLGAKVVGPSRKILIPQVSGQKRPAKRRR